MSPLSNPLQWSFLPRLQASHTLQPFAICTSPLQYAALRASPNFLCPQKSLFSLPELPRSQMSGPRLGSQGAISRGPRKWTEQATRLVVAEVPRTFTNAKGQGPRANIGSLDEGLDAQGLAPSMSQLQGTGRHLGWQRPARELLMPDRKHGPMQAQHPILEQR